MEGRHDRSQPIPVDLQGLLVTTQATSLRDQVPDLQVHAIMVGLLNLHLPEADTMADHPDRAGTRVTEVADHLVLQEEADPTAEVRVDRVQVQVEAVLREVPDQAVVVVHQEEDKS